MKREAVTDALDLADRYVAIWIEPDAERRRRAVSDLWTEDAVHFLRPPDEVLRRAAALNIGATFQARGHRELEARVARAYDEFVAPGEFTFRRRDNVARLGDVVKFSWDMVSTRGGDPAGSGLEFLVLAADGRIRLDYQFIEA